MFNSLIKILQQELDKINATISNSEKENKAVSKFLEEKFEIFKDNNGLYDVSNIYSFFERYLSSHEINNIRMGLLVLNNCNGLYNNEFASQAFFVLNNAYEKIKLLFTNQEKINAERKSNILKYQSLLAKFSTTSGRLINFFTPSEIDALSELLQKVEFYDYKVISELNKASIALYEEKLAIIKCIEENRTRVLKSKSDKPKTKRGMQASRINDNEQILKAKSLLEDSFQLPEKDFIDLFNGIKVFITDLDSLKKMANDWTNEQEKIDYFMLFIKSLIEDENRRSPLDMEMLQFSLEEVERCKGYIKVKEDMKNNISFLIERMIEESGVNNLSDFDRKNIKWASENIFDDNLNIISANINIINDFIKRENSISLCILFKMVELRDKLMHDNLNFNAFKEIFIKIQKLNDLYELYSSEKTTNEIIEEINEICSFEGSFHNIQIIFMPMGHNEEETSIENFAYTYEAKNKNNFNNLWLKSFIGVLKELRNFSLADLTNDALCKHDVTNENTGYRCRRKGNTRCVFQIIKRNDITILLIMAYGHKYDVSHEWEYLQTKKMINIHDDFIKKLEEEIETLGISKTIDTYHQKTYDSLIRLGLITGAIKIDDISKLDGVK